MTFPSWTPAETAGGIVAILWMGLIILLTVLAVLWTVLPFAVFGIKARLDKISRELESIRRIGVAQDLERIIPSHTDEVSAKASRSKPPDVDLPLLDRTPGELLGLDISHPPRRDS